MNITKINKEKINFDLDEESYIAHESVLSKYIQSTFGGFGTFFTTEKLEDEGFKKFLIFYSSQCVQSEVTPSVYEITTSFEVLKNKFLISC